MRLFIYFGAVVICDTIEKEKRYIYAVTYIRLWRYIY